MTDAPQQPADWYPDREVPGGWRYWDGSAWTEHRKAPAGPPAANTLAAPSPDQMVASATPSEKSGLGNGAKIGIGIVAAVLVLGVVAAVSSGGKDSPAASATPTLSASETSTPAPESSTPDASPTETSTPSPTETVAPVAKPVTYRGSGNKVLKIVKPEPGAMLITTTIKGPSDNNTIYALDADLKEGDLLVNTIGSYHGTSILDGSGDTDTTRLKIDVSGSWVITLSTVSSARVVTTAIKGSKDDVLLYVADTAAILTFKSTSGDSNVTAYWITGDGSDLLINDIGKFTAEAPMTAGPGFIQVSSDGAWTISISPA